MLVDDELIFAFYDQQLPADVCSGASLERWYRDEAEDASRKLLHADARRADAPRGGRHHDRGLPEDAAPGRHRLRGRATCTSPATRKDGVTVTVPIYALNQVSDERCEWLVPGMLKDKVLALLKSLHQRPRSRLVPLPDYADEFCARHALRARAR